MQCIILFNFNNSKQELMMYYLRIISAKNNNVYK